MTQTLSSFVEKRLGLKYKDLKFPSRIYFLMENVKKIKIFEYSVYVNVKILVIMYSK